MQTSKDALYQRMFVYDSGLRAQLPPIVHPFSRDELQTVLSDACVPDYAPHAGVVFVLSRLLQSLHVDADIWPSSVQLMQVFLNHAGAATASSAAAIIEPLLMFAHCCARRHECLLRAFSATLTRVLRLCCANDVWVTVNRTNLFRKLAVLMHRTSSFGKELAGDGAFLQRLMESTGIEHADHGPGTSPLTCTAAFTALCLLPRVSVLDSDVFRRGFMNCAASDVPVGVMLHMLDACLPFMPLTALEGCVRLAWSHVQHAVVLSKSCVVAYCALFARVAALIPAALAVPFTEPRTSLNRLCHHVDVLMAQDPCSQLEFCFYQFASSAWKLTLSEDARCTLVGTLVRHASLYAVVEGTVLLVRSGQDTDAADVYEQAFADNAPLPLAVRLVRAVASGEAVHASLMQAACWMAQLNLHTATALEADRDFINDVATVYTHSTDPNCRTYARDILEEVAGDYFDETDEDEDVPNEDDDGSHHRFDSGVIVGEAALCIVCLETNTGPFVFLPCAHQFHVECMNTWLNTGASSCPLCKRPLTSADYFSQ